MAHREAAYVAWEADMEDAVAASTPPSLVPDPSQTPKMLLSPPPPSTATAPPSSPLANLPLSPVPSTASRPSPSASPRVVILEIGCGLRVPTLRIEAETVYRDILFKLCSSTDTPPSNLSPQGNSGASSTGVSAELSATPPTTTPRVSLVRINVDFPQVPLPQDALDDFNNSNNGTTDSSANKSSSSNNNKNNTEAAFRDAWAANAVSVRGTALESLRAIDAAIETAKSADMSS